VLCQITPAGLRLLDQLEAIMNELDERMVQTLSEDELKTLISLLERIRQQEPL
jgi:DNA-binding MarR family transcriptional regulator